MTLFNEQCSNRWPAWKVVAVGGVFVLAFGAWWVGCYENYHVVLPGELYRSGQLSGPALRRRIEADRLRSVINLRPETDQSWPASEPTVCRERGVAYMNCPLLGDQLPTPAQTAALVTVLSHAARPLLIHCEHGADRTSFAVALYLAAIAHVPATEAKRAFGIRYGHLSFTRVGCFDRAFELFLQERTGRAVKTSCPVAGDT